jgi:superfamily II DNA helicase RecQ
MRIAYILQQYKIAHGLLPKCLCYCLGKAKCKKVAGLLNKSGIQAASMTAKERKEKTMDSILASFSRKEISVLCCTGGKWYSK